MNRRSPELSPELERVRNDPEAFAEVLFGRQLTATEKLVLRAALDPKAVKRNLYRTRFGRQ